MTTIILSGGVGSRLWPLSRDLFTKQFITLFQGESLFQKTLKRNHLSNLWVVTHDNYYHTAYNQARECVGVEAEKINFLLEEIQKDTTLALACASFFLDSEEMVLSVASDHLIKDEKAYQIAIEQALELARRDYIVTFGIKPTYPETGFGYIHACGEDVLAFKEKPSLEKAQLYCQAGDYLWNSGMFCFRAGFFLEELKQYAPNIYNIAKEAHKNALCKNQKHTLKRSDIKDAPSISIDYALIEKTTRIKVVQADMGWSDVGGFEGLYGELPKDKDGNAIYHFHHQSPKPELLNAKNNLILQSHREIALIDVEDLMIVDTPDVLLVAKKGSGQKVKDIYKQVKAHEHHRMRDTHFLMYRPWGNFVILEEDKGYKIKKIEVSPTKRLSLQKHFCRSEHWIVMSGTAIVQLNDQEITLHPNESIYIPVGEKHRLSNPDQVPLIIIEVQIGAYLGEDDIVRFDDDYCRDGLMEE